MSYELVPQFSTQFENKCPDFTKYLDMCTMYCTVSQMKEYQDLLCLWMVMEYGPSIFYAINLL